MIIVINLGRLTESVSNVVLTCSSNYRDKDKKKRFKESSGYIEQYTAEYEAGMAQHDAQVSMLPSTPSNVTVSNAEMRDLYRDKLAKKGQPGRRYYDRLMVLSPNKRCPYCAVDHVTTVDHYFSKDEYPYLSVSLQNLIPSCAECNHLKGSRSKMNGFPVLHPYFDDLDDGWLRATVAVEDGVPVARYELGDVKAYGESLGGKIREHFRRFDLAERYSLQAADELSQIPSVVVTPMAISKDRHLEIDDLLEAFRVIYEQMKQNGGYCWRVALYANLCKSYAFSQWALDVAVGNMPWG